MQKLVTSTAMEQLSDDGGPWARQLISLPPHTSRRGARGQLINRGLQALKLPFSSHTT